MHNKSRNYTKQTPWKNKIGVFKAHGGWIVRVWEDGYMKTISRHSTEKEALIKFNEKNG
jgi:hypothetical protein